MPRYGAQYGPDITFLGVDRCDLEDAASFADADVVVLVVLESLSAIARRRRDARDPDPPGTRPCPCSPTGRTGPKEIPHDRAPARPVDRRRVPRRRRVLRRDRSVDERWRFAAIELREPAKDVVRSFRAGDPIRREARVTCWSRDEGTTYKALVSLTDESVLSWEAVPGEQANMTVDEWHEAHEALIAHPDVIAALAKRGITDLDLVLIDTWAYGHSLIPAEFADRRVGWTDVWRRSTPLGNPYANPVNGLHLVVDLNTMELLRIEDTAPPAGGSPMGEYRPDLVPGLVQRTDIKALDVVQPEGPSFTLEGNELRWQNWTMRLGFNYREGLVIHRVGWTTATSCAPSPTGSPSPRWSCPTATRPRTTTAGPPSTSASGAWAS